jgi:hypothetical protein
LTFKIELSKKRAEAEKPEARMTYEQFAAGNHQPDGGLVEQLWEDISKLPRAVIRGTLKPGARLTGFTGTWVDVKTNPLANADYSALEQRVAAHIHPYRQLMSETLCEKNLVKRAEMQKRLLAELYGTLGTRTK